MLTGVWSALRPGASFTLPYEHAEEGEPSRSVVVTVSAVTVEAGRTVIALSWERIEGAGREPGAFGGPARIVIGNRGVWLVGGDSYTVKDASGAPTHPDPPVNQQRPDGTYTTITDIAGEPIACLGMEDLTTEEGDEGALIGCGSDCFGALCVGGKSGFVKVVGTWGPHGDGDYGTAAYADLGLPHRDHGDE